MSFSGCDETAPAVDSVFSSDGEIDVFLNTVLRAAFDEDVVSASVSPSAFTLESNLTLIGGSVVYSTSTKTATSAPGVELSAKTQVTRRR